MVEIRDCTQLDVDQLKSCMRKGDIEECEALGLKPKHALQTSYDISPMSWSAHYKNRVFCIFGIVPLSYTEGTCSGWLLASDVLTHNKKIVQPCIKVSKEYFDHIFQYFDVITNVVKSDNTTAVRWLKCFGAEMLLPEPLGVNGELFNKFIIRKAQ